VLEDLWPERDGECGGGHGRRSWMRHAAGETSEEGWKMEVKNVGVVERRKS